MQSNFELFAYNPLSLFGEWFINCIAVH